MVSETTLVCSAFSLGSLSSEELADVERLKRIFRGYFADHDSFLTIKPEELQAIVEQRAHACAAKYREKLRRLHLSHADYYLDTIHRLSVEDQLLSEPLVTATTFIRRTTALDRTIGYPDLDEQIMSISVV